MKFLIQSITSRITRKYLLIFSLILIIPTLAIYRWIIQYSEDVMETDIIRNNGISADSVVKRINTEISDVVLQLQLVAGQNTDRQLNEETMYQRAKQVISQSSIIHSIYFLDASQRIRFEAPFLRQANEITYKYPQFDHVRWSYTYVVSGIVPNYRNEQVATVAIPVFYGDRAFQGVLIAEISREYLSEILKSTSSALGGFSFLVDQSGRVIASTNESEWGKSYAGTPVVDRLLNWDAGTVKENYLGEQSLITYRTMRENWGVALGLPERVAFQHITPLSKVLTISYSIIFLLTVCLIVLGMQQILYPIVRLTQFARNFNQKRSSIELPDFSFHAKDEIAILMKTMAAMATNIEEKERFLNDVIEGIPYALITVDQTGTITHVNQKMLDLTGLSKSYLMGKHLSVLPELASLQEMPQETEISLLDRLGYKRIVRMVTAPFHDGSLAVLQDVSQLKLWEAQFKQSEKLALMGQITAGIAHELKNPLAVIASSSELLKEEMSEQPYSDGSDFGRRYR